MHAALSILFTAALALSNAPSDQPVSSTTLLKTTSSWNGAPIRYLASDKPEVQAVVVEVAPGAATAWHKHPVNNFAYILEGELRLELEDHTTHVFKAGEAFAEVVNTWHRGVNVGAGPLKILVFYSSEVGAPISIPKAAMSARSGLLH
jgi:quercetin dioxygenase-like cupin family protein